MREGGCLCVVLQTTEEVQEAGGEQLRSPLGVIEPERQDAGQKKTKTEKLKTQRSLLKLMETQTVTLTILHQ